MAAGSIHDLVFKIMLALALLSIAAMGLLIFLAPMPPPRIKPLPIPDFPVAFDATKYHFKYTSSRPRPF